MAEKDSDDTGMTRKNIDIIFTIALTFFCAAPAIFLPNYAVAAGLYKFFVISNEAGVVGESNGILRMDSASIKPADFSELKWSEIPQRILWPFGEVTGEYAEAQVVFSDESTSSITSFMKLYSDDKTDLDGADCAVYSITIEGRSGDEQDSVAFHSNAFIKGNGRALVCARELLPRAINYSIERKVIPALWEIKSSEMNMVSRVDMAWSAVP